MIEAEQNLEQVMGWDNDESTPDIKYYYNVQQHTDEWLKIKKGVISASIMGKLLKKKTDRKTGEVTYSVPDTDTTRAIIYQIAAERIAPDIIEDNYQSRAMERGVADEVEAFNLYSEKYHQLKSCGFIINYEHGVPLGYSPDGLTALHADGITECKSRALKFQVETIALDTMDDGYAIQVQTGLLVTKRKWCDFISYAGGMEMFVKKIKPDEEVQKTIIQAAKEADVKINEIVQKYKDNVKRGGFHMTTRRLDDIVA